jgi:hypothetical protein
MDRDGPWREHNEKPRAVFLMIVIYGGSMYGAADPIYMLMLIKALGPEYVVWDKAASLHFKKRARARSSQSSS